VKFAEIVLRQLFYDMPNSYVRIWIHAGWSTKYRDFLIHFEKEKVIHDYMKEQFEKMGCPVRAINGMPDHVHALFMLNPNVSLAKIIQQVKGSTSYFINKNNIIPEYFKWQDGFWAKALGDDAVKIVHSYIRHQKRRHCKQLRYQ
jgi:REP element-mobilizing transposase RayT